ncbi:MULTISPECIES: phosphoribosyltransferase [unclassified Crossiella]|uniref:phosphoribosyltransferase n=1 Tax=unclassified Crossiella TaxID=2620835 RepID=UPI001FFEDC83|nr:MULTISPECIES: phosphoribosyltransferase [unclassified Crossiella]MCK2236299.1 phosphoribosyltransferase [Crossiella sp. S99.2]MCK2249966.1 phosphoribosyltransferase [Crossiella sp. S99.1]
MVTPIALAVKGGQFARELSLYKNGDNRAQATLFNGFATILEYFLRQHETCLASAAQAERFEVVAAVPSTRGRLSHPLHRMLSSNIGRTRARFVPALAPVPGFADRVFTPDRFQVCADVADRNVLLVDDTWTTGSHAQSACAALKDAGAARVGVLVLGRHFEPSTGTARDYLARARSQLFDWDRCCLGQSGRGRCA